MDRPYGKINKATARALYDSGEPVWFLPAKKYPGDKDFPGMRFENNAEIEFDSICKVFRYAFCTSEEMGKGIHFYRNKAS